MSSIYGLESEIEALEERLSEAQESGDSVMESCIQGRIDRVENEINNINFFNNYYGDKK